MYGRLLSHMIVELVDVSVHGCLVLVGHSEKPGPNDGMHINGTAENIPFKYMHITKC